MGSMKEDVWPGYEGIMMGSEPMSIQAVDPIFAPNGGEPYP